MMGIAKLNMLSLVSIITCLHLVIFAVGNSPPSTSLSDKEDIVTTFLRTEADVIARVKKNILLGKEEGKKEFSMKPMDCAEVLQSGYHKSGVYTIWPKNKIIDGSVEVYCDMDTDGGGWTVIQRRGDFGPPEDYFYRDWDSYKRGFGDVKEDFWLGNDLIYAITSQTRYSIRFDLGDFQGNRVHALYANFWIEGESAQYLLHISNYSGNATDCMIGTHDGMKFSTKDRHNDQHSSNCAELRKGAWWYKACNYANLNGLYLKGNITDTAVYWHKWKKSSESLSTTEMKIRPKSFQKAEYKAL